MKKARQAIEEFLASGPTHIGYCLTAAHLALRLEAPMLALQCVDVAIDVSPAQPRPWLEKARLEIELSHFNDATTSIATAKRRGARDIEAETLECQLLAARGQEQSAMERLQKQVSSSQPERREAAIASITDMVAMDIRKAGPLALVRWARRIRKTMAKCMGGGILGDVLTDFLARYGQRLQLADEEWLRASQLLEEAVGDLVQCELPIRLISALVRYAAEGESVLLELPAEERELLISLLELNNECARMPHEDASASPNKAR